MPAEPLSHLMHTLTIFIVFISILAVFQAYALYSYTDALKHQLADIEGYVSSVATDLVILVTRSKFENITLTKTLNLPESVGMYGYTVKLENRGEDCVLVIYLDARPSVKVESILPVKNVTCSGVVYSGSRNPRICCSRVLNADGSYNMTLKLEG
ncbi:hypothetical protein DRO58_05900 [Candidatus Bathyarchaeota archaeon]|nr:MAG: hypothetical protein DRO58_05900 [Candidatus Bathyarchaeota archaeon]